MPLFKGVIMPSLTNAHAKQRAVFMPMKKMGRTFNYNKLQAFLCLAGSAAISVSLIIWVIKVFG
jgi:hypothetical protein